MRRFVVSLALGLVAPGALAGQTPEVAIEWGVKVPLRDGVRLSATVYRPRAASGPLPVVFTLTPYLADTYHRFAMAMARDGYIFAAVDVRGRGNSDGAFEPFVNEGRDGHDVVEFFAAQPWSNGRIAMWGGSYGGTDQWATLKEFPPHLVTIVPVAPAYLGIDFPMVGNIPSSYLPQWLTFTSGKAAQGQLFADMAQWAGYARILRREKLPFASLDSVAGNRSAIFQKWLEHPTPDDYWDGVAPTPAQYARMDHPILTITGHYDGDQLGTLTHYRKFLEHASPRARDRIYLVMGPWNHGGTRTPTREVNGVQFGPASMVDIHRLNREWYDWTMRSAASRPSFIQDKVTYYVAGAGGDVWRSAPTLDAATRERRPFYLHSDGKASDVFGGGRLATAAPDRSVPDEYRYNPLDPPMPGDVTNPSALSFVDQTRVMTAAGNGVVYHTAPFDEELEIAGQPVLTVWVALDVPDTDFEALLYEVLPDGSSIHLARAQLRARYRESLRQEKLVPPGVPLSYRLDNFNWFARRIAKGSRVRLVFRSPNGLELQQNFNSGGVVARETARDARTARVTVFHDRQRPSVLELPIGR
ncbi:MAG: CocE/NonD family hydrolase [Gemmatimonadetes bacterium]|nr:CocE/NonD family hydrolase [Gemmatimonadota bacterium]